MPKWPARSRRERVRRIEGDRLRPPEARPALDRRLARRRTARLMNGADGPPPAAKHLPPAPPCADEPPPEVTLHTGDCRDVLPAIPAESVHLVLTDPPYFLDRLDDGWSPAAIARSQKRADVVGGLPVGMKFDPGQGRNLQAFLAPIAAELLRVLKPGAFLLLFAAPRLYHRAAVAVEDAGFEVRDAFAWHFTRKAQFKAFTMDHFIRRRTDMTPAEKTAALEALDGRRTPQLRPQFESILCAQKPRAGTFVDNWLAHRTGLIDPRHSLTGRVPETLMMVEKEAKPACNGHLTPKPVPLCEHLIRLFSAEGQTVLDPFVGSGTTCLAARMAGRPGIGVDVNPDYIRIARRRLG